MFGSSGKKDSVLGDERKPRDTHWFCFVLDEKLNSEARLFDFCLNFLLGVVWLVRKLGSKKKVLTNCLFCVVGDGWAAQLRLFCFSSLNFSFWVLFGRVRRFGKKQRK